MNILDAIETRASTRAFLDREVDKEIIEKILLTARWAPSSTNTQPWQVAVLRGTAKQRLCTALLQAAKEGKELCPDYPHYPELWVEPYKARRFACGMALYEAAGVKREDKQKRLELWQRNYQAFGAPCVLLFFIDAHLGKASWLDYGMFLENIMLAAQEYGLQTCAQASLSNYPDLVRQQLGEIYNDKHLICGLALGYADKTAKINAYRTEREPLNAFCQWFDENK